MTIHHDNIVYVDPLAIHNLIMCQTPIDLNMNGRAHFIGESPALAADVLTPKSKQLAYTSLCKLFDELGWKCYDFKDSEAYMVIAKYRKYRRSDGITAQVMCHTMRNVCYVLFHDTVPDDLIYSISNEMLVITGYVKDGICHTI